MKIAQNLSRAWQEAIASGNVINEFEASEDDPAGRWLTGDRLHFGLVWSGKDVQYDARNIRTGQRIEATVSERTIEDTGVVCQFNGYRALRPGGTPKAIGRQPDISPVPGECRFFCQAPAVKLSLLNRAPLLQVKLENTRWSVYHNANPFEKDGHFLLLPVQGEGLLATLPHYQQMLTPEFVEDLVLLFRQAPELVIFFNSLHAGASVNHVHAQAVFHQQRMAIEDAGTVEYKGFEILDGYPAQGLYFSSHCDIGRIATSIEKLQMRSIPFNLVLIGKRIVLIPRNADHEITAEFPGGALATMGVSGKIITAYRQVYERASAADVRRAMQNATLSVKELIDESWSA